MALDVKISYSWTNYCRLCLLDEGIMAPLFDGEGLNRQIGHKIETCLQLVTYDGDPLPTKICHKCLYKIDQAYEFRTMALNSYERIKSHLLPLKHVPSVEQYLVKAGHLKNMGDLDVPSNLASSTQSAQIRVKSEMELMGDAHCSSCPPNLDSLFSHPSSTPKPSSSREPTSSGNRASITYQDTLKRKRLSLPPDSTSLEDPQRNLFPTMKRAKTLAGPASRKRPVESPQWQCVFCLSYFSNRASLNSHLEKCLRCGVCQKDFSSFEKKVIHEADHICVPVDCEATHLKWKCSSCPARFASSVMLSTHSKYNHPIPPMPETNYELVSKSNVFLDENGTSRTLFSCITCNEQFHSDQLLLDHEKIIHGRFRCSSCSEVFDSLKALSSHKRCHTAQTSIKKYFEKNGKSSSPIKKKPLSCNICYESFDEEDNFVLHLYHHATEQSDDESVPPKKSRKDGKKKKSTITKTVLNIPDNTSEQFSVKCERCHVVCRSKEYYKVHLATHVSKAKTSFPCSGCLQDFRNVEALNRHTCCGKQLNDLNKCCLDCGQGLVDGENHVCDNKCPECDKVFKSARGQRLHFAFKHMKKDSTEDGNYMELDEDQINEDDMCVQNQNGSGCSLENQRESCMENQEHSVESEAKGESYELPQAQETEERREDSSENGQSDSDNCICTDSDSGRSSRESPPVERLPPDGASIVEPASCEFDSSNNDFGQSKISEVLETNQKTVCLEAAV